jgi:hypothetical protein
MRLHVRPLTPTIGHLRPLPAARLQTLVHLRADRLYRLAFGSGMSQLLESGSWR